MLKKRFCRIMKGRRAEGYVDVAVLVLSLVLVLALALRVLPVFIAKQQLDTFATELTGVPPSCGKRQESTRRSHGLTAGRSS